LHRGQNGLGKKKNAVHLKIEKQQREIINRECGKGKKVEARRGEEQL